MGRTSPYMSGFQSTHGAVLDYMALRRQQPREPRRIEDRTIAFPSLVLSLGANSQLPIVPDRSRTSRRDEKGTGGADQGAGEDE